MVKNLQNRFFKMYLCNVNQNKRHLRDKKQQV